MLLYLAWIALKSGLDKQGLFTVYGEDHTSSTPDIRKSMKYTALSAIYVCLSLNY